MIDRRNATLAASPITVSADLVIVASGRPRRQPRRGQHILSPRVMAPGGWFALALFGVAASPSDAWWLFAGALAMLGMLLGASIPLLETRSLQRRPGYQEVIDRVPRFVPRPPSRISAG
jgi:hypothetical protein